MEHSAQRFLTVDDHIGDLLRHPAFAGFARLLLPWDNHGYDDQLPLKEIASLLPYHSHVDAQVIVSSLNRMIANAGHDEPVFHDFYNGEQKGEVPSRANAGLFFFRGTPGAPFAIIAPGGGFRYVASLHEGFPYAVQIANSGYNAFVLKYRHGHGGAPAEEDIAAALAYIVENAQRLAVGTSGYSIWGSSAGAQLAASIVQDGDHLHKPAATVLAYPGRTALCPGVPATFIVAGEQDAITPPAELEGRIAELASAGACIEFRKYPQLGHGFGPGTGTWAEGWIPEAIEFWRRTSAAPAQRLVHLL